MFESIPNKYRKKKRTNSKQANNIHGAEAHNGVKGVIRLMLSSESLFCCFHM